MLIRLHFSYLEKLLNMEIQKTYFTDQGKVKQDFSSQHRQALRYHCGRHRKRQLEDRAGSYGVRPD